MQLVEDTFYSRRRILKIEKTKADNETERAAQ